MFLDESIHASFPFPFPWGSCWVHQCRTFGSDSEAAQRPGIQSCQPDLHTSHTELAMCGAQQNLIKKQKNQRQIANREKNK